MASAIASAIPARSPDVSRAHESLQVLGGGSDPDGYRYWNGIQRRRHARDDKKRRRRGRTGRHYVSRFANPCGPWLLHRDQTPARPKQERALALALLPGSWRAE